MKLNTYGFYDEIVDKGWLLLAEKLKTMQVGSISWYPRHGEKNSDIVKKLLDIDTIQKLTIRTKIPLG